MQSDNANRLLLTAAHRPLRLLQIGKYFFPDQGGVETVTLAISKALLDHGIQADVLSFSQRPFYPDYEGPFRVIRSKTAFRISNKTISFDYIRKIAELAELYDVGLLHMPNPLGMIGALRYWRRPLILLWHADIITYPRLGRLLRGLERKVIQRAARVIVPTSAHVSGSYVARELADKACVIPFPFDRSRLPEPDREGRSVMVAREFAGERRIVLAIGRLVPYKGFDVLISAARFLEPRSCVVIVGSGPLRKELERIIVRNGLGSKVLLLGSVGEAELAALLEAAHVLAMPSVTRAEMYGMAQVEAMSFGKPVVSTRIPGSGVSCVNVHNETGLTVEPGDAVALADALNRILTNEVLYRALSAGALRAVLEVHDAKESGRRLAEVVHMVAGSGSLKQAE